MSSMRTKAGVPPCIRLPPEAGRPGQDPRQARPGRRGASGRAAGRTTAAQITPALLRDAVTGTAFVDDIDLVAEPEDPKDLFGMCCSPVPVG